MNSRVTTPTFTLASVVLTVFLVAALPALAADKKPNILVIWGDDIGRDNISAYSRGIMGYHTPNIDRIAKEGALFTDSYAQQSCTAGRASFIMGEHPFRTGLLTIAVQAEHFEHGLSVFEVHLALMCIFSVFRRDLRFGIDLGERGCLR